MKLSVQITINNTVIVAFKLLALCLAMFCVLIQAPANAQSTNNALTSLPPLIGTRTIKQLQGAKLQRLRRRMGQFAADFLPTVSDPHLTGRMSELERVGLDAPTPSTASAVTSNEQTFDVTLENAFASTVLSNGAVVGSTVLPVVSADGFAVGEKVTIDPNTLTSETVTITAVADGSLTVTATVLAHTAGAVVSAADADGVPTIPTGQYTDVAWSHSELFLVFAAIAPGDTHYHLYAMLTSGGPIAYGPDNTPIYIEQLTTGTNDERYPSLLGPDDNEIAYCSDDNANDRYQLVEAPFSTTGGAYSVTQTEATALASNLEARHPFIDGNTVYFSGRANSTLPFDIYSVTTSNGVSTIAQITGGGVADNDNPTVVSTFLAWDSNAAMFTYTLGATIPLTATAISTTDQRNIYASYVSGFDVTPTGITTASTTYSNSHPQWSTANANDFSIQNDYYLFFQSNRPIPYGNPADNGTTHLYYFGGAIDQALVTEADATTPAVTQINTSDSTGYTAGFTPAGESNGYSDTQVAVSQLVAPYIAVAYISNRYLVDHNFDNPLLPSSMHNPTTLATANAQVTLDTATTLTAIVMPGSTVLPVASSKGFTQGQLIDIELGSKTNFETATITAVATGQLTVTPITLTHAAGISVIAADTTLTGAVAAGATTLPVTSSAGFVVGETVELDRGTSSDEFVIITQVIAGTLTVSPVAIAHLNGGTVSPTVDQEPASVPVTPGAASEVFVSRLLDQNAPSLVRYNEGTDEVVHMIDGPLFNADGSTNYDPTVSPTHYVKAGDQATIIVRLSDRQTGLGQVWAQIKDPNSFHQNTTGLEHKIYSQQFSEQFHPYFNEATTLFDAQYSFPGLLGTYAGNDGNPIQVGNQITLDPTTFTHLTKSSTADTLTVGSTADFGVGSAIEIDYAGALAEIAIISGIVGDVITTTDPLAYAHAVGEQVRLVTAATTISNSVPPANVQPPQWTIPVASSLGLAVGEVVCIAPAAGGATPEYGEIISIPSTTSFVIDRGLAEQPATRDLNLGLQDFYASGDTVFIVAQTAFDPTGNEIDCEAIDTSLVANDPVSGLDLVSTNPFAYHIPDYTPSIDDTIPFDEETGGTPPTYWLKMVPLPADLQDHNGGVLYYGSWTTPTTGSDYYIDIIAEDASALQSTLAPQVSGAGENWAIYDNVWGFYTLPFTSQHNILVVNDYALAQKFFSRGDNGPINYYGTESYWTDVNQDVVGWDTYFHQTPTEQVNDTTTDAPTAVLPLVAEEFNGNGVLVQREKMVYGFDPGLGGQASDYWPPYTNGLGVNSYEDGDMGQVTTYGTGAEQGPLALSQEYDIWRILSRGPVPLDIMQSYGGKSDTEPANPNSGSTATISHFVAPSLIVWLSPYSGDTFVGPGTITDPQTQDNLEEFLNAGGRLHIEGKDIGYALTSDGAVANTFYDQYLCDNGTTQSFLTDNVGNATDVFALTATGQGQALISRDAWPNSVHDFWYPTGDGDVGVTTSPDSQPITIANEDETTTNRTDAALDCAGYNDTGFIGGEDNDSFIDGFATGGYSQLTGTTNQEEYYENAATGSIVSYCSFGISELSQQVNDFTGGPNPVYFVVDQRTKLIHNIVCALRTGYISGTVSPTNGSGAGQPLNGVIVSAVLTGTTTPVYTAETEGGTYTLEGLVPGNYTLSAYLQGYTFQHVTIGSNVHGGDTATVDLNVTPASNGSMLVNVVNAAGTPIYGATVTLTEVENGPVPSPETTDSSGNALFDNVESGIYTVTVSDPGYTTAVQTDVQVNPETQTYVPIVLQEQPATITGEITDAKTGKPIVGATVILVNAVGAPLITSGGTQLAVLSGAGGIYTITVPGASYASTTVVYVEAGYTGYATSTPVSIGAIVGGKTYTQNIALVPQSTINVTVIDSNTLAPIPGVSVTANGTGTTTADYGPIATGANGSVNFSPVTAGTYDIGAVPSSYIALGYADVLSVTPANPVTVAGSATTSVVIKLQPATGALTGTVTDAVTKKPIAGATVTLTSAAGATYTATSGINGVYDILDIADGSYTATASATNYASLSVSVTITTAKTVTQNFPLQPVTGTLTGKITSSASGLPIPGATVTVTVAGSTYTGTANASGVYTITFVPIGTQTATASAALYVTKTAMVVITGDGTTTQNFALEPTTGNLTGTVTSAATGLPLSGATVTFVVNGTTLTATTNAAGVYSFTAVLVGTYAVTASAFLYDAVTETVTIEGGETVTQNFSLPRGVVHVFPPGLQMFSVPYDYNNNTLSQILSGAYDATTGAQNVIAAWLPLENAYVKTPTAPCDTIHDGQGYWGRFVSTGGFLYAGGAAVTSKSIVLYPGWNMIGDPYTSAFPLANVMVYDSTGQNEYTFANASSSTLNILNPLLYTYDPTTNSYVQVSIGNPTGSAAPDLTPYVGYWIEAYTTCTLQF